MEYRLEDIAKLAGVNSSTVSRAINNPQKVKVKTRQKIQAIINELGYKPNFYAQGLMKNQTDSVGILTTLYANPYFMEITETLEHLLAIDGTYMYLCNCENNIKLEKKYLDELIRRKIDALFVIESPSLNTKNNFYIKNKFNFPVIMINQHVEPYGDNYIVRCDQKPGITEVFDEVARLELYPFVLLIPSEKTYSYILKERLFKDWQKKNHITDMQACCIILEDLLNPNSEKSVWYTYEETKKIFNRFHPRSIMAGNDLMAMGVLAAAREHGINVPHELSIAGVDNTLFSRISIPALSTIDLRTNEIGTRAAQVYKTIKNESVTAPEHIQTINSNFCRRETFIYET